MRRLAAAYENYFNRISQVYRNDSVQTWTERLERAGLTVKECHAYFSRSAMNLFDLMHYYSSVTLLYKKTDVTESVADEAIYWWNPDKLAWEPAPNLSVDVKNGALSSGLTHFSTYSIFGTRAGW